MDGKEQKLWWYSVHTHTYEQAHTHTPKLTWKQTNKRLKHTHPCTERPSSSDRENVNTHYIHILLYK